MAHTSMYDLQTARRYEVHDLNRRIAYHENQARELAALRDQRQKQVDVLTEQIERANAYEKKQRDEGTVPAVVYRGHVVHDDGSKSPVERWVKAADGAWISLDSERRTNRDLMLEVE